jgi:hypothetical protein
MGNREPSRDMSSALRGLPECRSPALGCAWDRTHDRFLNHTNCEPQDLHSCKTSQAGRILSHPEQRLGWGREGGLHEVTAAYCRIRSRRRAAMSRRATSSRLDLSVQCSREPGARPPAPSLQGAAAVHPACRGARLSRPRLGDLSTSRAFSPTHSDPQNHPAARANDFGRESHSVAQTALNDQFTTSTITATCVALGAGTFPTTRR